MKKTGIRWIATTLAVATALLAGAPAFAQLDLPRPSPKATVSQVVGLTEVSITYSSPGVKGREIWGGLVPYDELWRTGANEVTIIAFAGDVKVDGNAVPAGKYSLFTVPGKESWTVVFNKNTEIWGTDGYKQEEDVLRFQVAPKEAPFAERMTFTFANTTTDSSEVTLTWDKLSVAFTVSVDVVGRVLADARKAMAEAKEDDWRTPLRAAMFCADNGVNLDEALAWADQGIARNAYYYTYFTKARLLAAKGDFKGAVEVAQKAIEAGQKAERKPDMAPAERAIAEWTAK